MKENKGMFGTVLTYLVGWNLKNSFLKKKNRKIEKYFFTKIWTLMLTH